MRNVSEDDHRIVGRESHGQTSSITWWWAAEARARRWPRGSRKIRSCRVCLLEWGPTDVGFEDVLQIRRWLGLLEGPLDLAYRRRCSPAATLTSCTRARRARRLLLAQHDDLVQAVPRRLAGLGRPGRSGWEPGHGAVLRAHPRPAPDRGGEGSKRDPVRLDRGLRRRPRRRPQHGLEAAPFHDGAGFLDVGYNDATGVRSSSSVMYLHPIMGKRANLRCAPRPARIRIEFSGNRAVAVHSEARAAASTGSRAAARSSWPAAPSTRPGC